MGEMTTLRKQCDRETALSGEEASPAPWVHGQRDTGPSAEGACK